ncbi:MAG: hypothetical protein Q7J04_07510, partial [Microcella sp.]|nr:hypothetical protein [Microcella sp.]
MNTRIARILALAVVLSTVPTAAIASSSGCADASQFGAGCPNISGEVGGDGATLSGNQTTPGSPGGSGGGSGGSGGPGGSGGGSGSGAGGPGGNAESPRPCEEVFVGLCYGQGQDKPGEPGDAAPGIPTVTLSDIAQFRPQPATQRMQPDGW